MKKIFTVLFSLMALMSHLSEVKAQVNVAWEEYGVKVEDLASATQEENQIFYLYNVTQKKFLSSGGYFGSQGTYANIGVQVKASQLADTYKYWDTTTDIHYYSFQSEVTEQNQGNYLGLDVRGANYNVYIDRPAAEGKLVVYPQWTITDSEAKTYTYKIAVVNIYGEADGMTVPGLKQWDWLFLKTNANNALISSTIDTTEEPADIWALVPVSKFREVIDAQTDQTYIDVSGLITDSRFIRNFTSPKWSTGLTSNSNENQEEQPWTDAIHKDFGTNGNAGGTEYAKNYGAMGATQINHATGTITQTITGLKPGMYAVSVQGFYYSEDANNKSAASKGYLIANDQTYPVPTLTEAEWNQFQGMADWHKDQCAGTGINMPNQYRSNVPAAEFLATNGEGMANHGNAIYASLNEDYKRVTIFVTVGNDGSLTLGMGKNDAEGRAYFDNMKLYYLGDFEFGIDAY